MNKKTITKINGGIAIYYGIGSVIAAALGVGAIRFMFFKVFTNSNTFPWDVFALMTTITVVLGLVGYALLRVGYEEFEK